jgi:hypothetical protein
MKGDSIFVMLQMVDNSGAMFSNSSLSVHVVPPVLGSSRADIVPPVIIIAMFGSFGFVDLLICFWTGFAFSRVLAERISDSRMPML